MKKLFTLFLIASLVFVFNGCARNTDIEDTPSPQSPIYGDENGNINEGYGNYNGIDRNGTNTNGIGTNGTGANGTGTNGTGRNGTNTTTGISGSGTYLNSLRDVDGTLRSTVRDMDSQTIDTNDKDYLSKSAASYRSRAAAYQTALNSVRGMNVDAANRSYNDSIVSYYQNGYDTYNNLANKYGTFKTTDDEQAYRSGLGRSAYDIKTDVRTGYENALRSMGINGDTTNSRYLND